MKKRMKKLAAIALAGAMVLSMSTVAFAAAPAATDKANVTIENVENGATVTAYQIIKATYNENGFTGYVWCIAIEDKGIEVGDAVEFDSDGNIVGLDDSVVTGLTSTTLNGLTSKSLSTTGGDLEAGVWVVNVTKASDAERVYNPMIVGVYYDTKASGDDATLKGGSIDADDTWTLAGDTAYAKSTKGGVDKTVTDDDNVYAVGSTVNFQLDDMTLPSYSAAYADDDVVYTITDAIQYGLEYTSGAPVVKVGGTTLTDGTEYDYKLSDDGKSFTITFKTDYLRKMSEKTAAERAVVVTYSAKITSDAVTKLGENKATVSYLNGSVDDTQYTGTFSIDGLIEKVGEDGKALEGAKFGLYTDEACTDENKVGEYTTLADGDIEFKGLNNQPYYLKEIAAPKGYQLNETVYTITFDDIVKEDNGKITSYSVYVDGTKIGTVTYGVASTEFGTTVANTKLSSLPSTGGIGTTIFTVAGCAIIVVAGGLLIVSRRKRNA